MPTNDNEPKRAAMRALPDAHGQAALLLTESLIHELVERSVLTTEDAIDIVETADSVQVELAEAADGAGAPMWRSHALLATIAGSLRHDRRSSETRPS